MISMNLNQRNHSYHYREVTNMCFKSYQNGTRADREFCAKRAAYMLLTLAFSLVLFSGLVGASTLPNGPHSSGTVEASKIGNLNTTSEATGAFASDCVTTSYAGPPAFYLKVPQADASALSVRFTPVNWDSLKTVSISVYDPGDGSWGDDTIKISIYDDGGGLPGALLASKILPPGSYSAYPSKTTVSFASLNLVFNNDFHVGVTTSGSVGSGRYESLLSDSGATDYVGRSSYFYQGQWYPISTGEFPDYNFFIEVYCCHFPITYVGDIGGYKYRDLDHDGFHDAGEPGIQGWRIEARQGSMSAAAAYAYTDATGWYVFHNLPYGTYYVTESQQLNWAQTAPVSVFGKVKVNAYATFFGPNFMNDTTCVCRHIDTCLAGTKDDFVGPEPSSPNPGLLAIMNRVDGGNGNGALARFDTTANNHGFGHTFTRCGDWDPTCWIVGAKLNMHLKATGDVPSTDYLALGDFKAGGIGSIWGIYLRKLASGGSWTLGNEMTVSLDLGALPAGGNGPSNIIAALQDGDLDVYIQDDTEVDYLELIVTICCPNTICGGKFNDKDHDAVRDFGEGGLQNWEIKLWASGNPNPVRTTTTDVNGKYDFLKIGAGTFSVTETQQTGWVQTAPLSAWFKVIMAANQQEAVLPYFGNTDTCLTPYDTTLHGGVNDNFSVANGSEPASPSTALAQWLAAPGNCSGGQLASFDLAATDRCFGHSFVGSWNTPLCYVEHARLYGRIKALSGSPDNDAINFGNWQAGIGSIWGLSLNELVNYSTTEVGVPLDGSWDTGDVISFSLDLGNLPEHYGITSVMSLFQSGGLDVVIQDDTEVDYLRLVLTICCDAPCAHGDANCDGTIDISDAVYLIAFIFSGGPAPFTQTAGDANCDGAVDISDAVYLIAYIFSGGPAPCEGSFGKLSPDNTSRSATLKLAENESDGVTSKTSAVEMQTDAEIAGMQLEFKGDFGGADEIVAKTTERSQNLQLFSGVTDGLYKVGLIDMTGKNAIAAGDGPIVNLEFRGDRRNLELVNAIASDRIGRSLNVAIKQTHKQTTLPLQYSLGQNYPNPFNPSTEIRFALPKSCEARIEVLNVLGQTVKVLASGLQMAGTHSVTWDGTDQHGNTVSSGIYFYRIISDEFTSSKKMLLLK
jgi:hypothetical protein